MVGTQQLVVDIHIDADELQRMYSGSARAVLAISNDGRRVRFPINILQPFVSHDGVHGRFSICYDAKGRFSTIQRHHL